MRPDYAAGATRAVPSRFAPAHVSFRSRVAQRHAHPDDTGAPTQGKKWLQDIPVSLTAHVRAPDTTGVPAHGTRLQFGDVPIGCIRWTTFTACNHGMAPDSIRCTVRVKREKARRYEFEDDGGEADEPSFVVVPPQADVGAYDEQVFRVGFFPHSPGAAKATIEIVSCGNRRVVRRWRHMPHTRTRVAVSASPCVTAWPLPIDGDRHR